MMFVFGSFLTRMLIGNRMWMNIRTSPVLCFVRPAVTLCLLFLFLAAPVLRAQSKDEFDSYKIRFEGYWVYSYLSGNFQGSNETGTIDLKKDLNFKSASFFSGKLDWKISHKNHLYFVVSPFSRSRETVLNKTIVYQGQTFQAGLIAKSRLEMPMYGVGYQYDIIRRKRGHLGIAVQVNLFDAHASIDAAAQVAGNGVRYAAVSASASLLAPLPVAGPDFRIYLTNSPRLFLDGHLYGMYLFGYGNYVSAAGKLGINIVKHVDFNAGYQVASRLRIHNDSDTNRIGIRFTQQGPFAGLQFSF
jgi:hypothetical protein